MFISIQYRHRLSCLFGIACTYVFLHLRNLALHPWQAFFHVGSGQVREFNVLIQSKLLLRTPVMGTGVGLDLHLCPGQGEGGNKGDPSALAGAREHQQSNWGQ